MDERLAYRAMFHYLDALWQRYPDIPLGALLGSMQLTPDGEPFDPAIKNEWATAFLKAMQEV